MKSRKLFKIQRLSSPLVLKRLDYDSVIIYLILSHWLLKLSINLYIDIAMLMIKSFLS